MKLYYAKGACSLAVRITLNELNIPCEYEAVDLKTKQTETGIDFATITPKNVVPVLVLDDHTILTENVAVLQYLAEHHPQQTMLPPTSVFTRYRVIEWLNFISTDLHKTCGVLFNERVPETIKEEVFKPSLENKLHIVDAYLQQDNYLLGDHFTLADTYLFVILFWLPGFKIKRAQWQHLDRYFKSLKQRDSIQKSLQEEGFKLK